MEWYGGVCIFMVLLCSGTLAYQVFKMTELDAKCRGFKHPRLWGLFATGGQNGGGLLMYLIARHKYPLAMTLSEKKSMESRKRKIVVCLAFLVVGAIGMIFTIAL